jgi:hypothetical protein
MTVNIEDRPIEAVREEVIDQLIFSYSHGEISLEAFERRLDSAMQCDDPHQLLALAADLTSQVDDKYRQQKQRELGAEQVFDSGKDVEYLVNILSGNDKRGIWALAKEIRVFTVFGGGDLDLSEARFIHKTTRIKLFSLFGGFKIFVPENINVVSNTSCILSGFSNKLESLAQAGDKTLVIEGLAIFSGIDVKIKRTVKEHFLRFADGLKKLLT